LLFNKFGCSPALFSIGFTMVFSAAFIFLFRISKLPPK
jgi:hypothetical protein